MTWTANQPTGPELTRLVRPRRAERTTTIALLVPDVTSPVCASIIRGVEGAAADAGCTMLLAGTQESADLERKALDRMAPAVDGVVLALPRMPDHTVQALAQQLPVVVLNRIVPGVSCVVPDVAAGIRGALDHLWDFGHRAVTYVAGTATSWPEGHRQRALLALAGERGMRVSRIGPFPPTAAGGLAALGDVLHHLPTAVLACNDLLAIGLLRGLTAAGVRVPEQLSLIGFDNILHADLCDPPLTTIAAPLRTMGAAAFAQLHSQIRGEPPRQQPVLDPAAHLVVRHSTASCEQSTSAPRPSMSLVAQPTSR